MSNTLWYFPIEPVASRYTEQLCNHWLPDAFKDAIKESKSKLIFTRVDGQQVRNDIKYGSVLDATGRGIYSLSQVMKFLTLMDKGAVKGGDILYFSDFWTPGIEAIFYAAHLMRIGLKYYSMCHAQSFDQYDFTYSMREWMRPIELGYANQHAGIFVASTVHKELLQVGGITAPIHVVSLPLGLDEVLSRMPDVEKENLVIYPSRLDWEKQPLFMLQVAVEFLDAHPDWHWVIASSNESVSSNIPGFKDMLRTYIARNPGIILRLGLSKAEYYSLLKRSKIIFNSSLQDFVSWTLLEASAAGCDLCYPNYRSFLEVVPIDRMYKAFNIYSALEVLQRCIMNPRENYGICGLAEGGRMKEASIVVNGYDGEYNIYEDGGEILYGHDI